MSCRFVLRYKFLAGQSEVERPKINLVIPLTLNNNKYSWIKQIMTI